MRVAGHVALGLILGWLTPALAVEPDAPERLVSRLDAASYEVQKQLAEPLRITSKQQKNAHGALVAFYADHGSELIWVDEAGLTAKAREVIAELERAAAYGLDPADYDVAAPADSEPAGHPASRLAALELEVSRAVLAYAHHARGGRVDPAEISRYLDPTLELPKPLDVIEKLASADDAAAELRAYHPRHPQFDALRRKLAAIRQHGRTRKHVVIPAGPVLKAEARHRQVALLRQRLEVPVPSAAGDPEVYDAAVVEAVTSFQKAQGLHADGVLGPATRRALNARPRDRVRTLLANMERWRWLPSDPGTLHIQVNVPEFRVRVVEEGETIHEERVVVGKVQNQTPIFSDEMEHIVFNPYWNVPNSIKVKEILPHMTRSSGWFGSGVPRILTQQNLRVKYRGRLVDPSRIDWRSVDIRRYHFFQPPGRRNVLGVVKFMFPNKHSVYLHDTTSKGLFERTVRAYSHGCIRVRNPKRLAELILQRDAGWSMSRIDKTIATGRNNHVRLGRKIPVHVTYFTATVDDQGRTRYFNDIYGHDARLAAALKIGTGS